jgi:outer membrane biosynthesis protein TonB
MGRAFYSAVVLLLLTAGCVRETPKTPQPDPAPPAPAPVAQAPESTTKGKAAPPVTKPSPQAQAPKTPAPGAQAPKQAPAPKQTPAPTAQAPKQPAPGAPATPRATAAATLDLESLKTQLKETKAIGVFTKLTLKNQVDDLLEKFREHHAGKSKPTMAELRRSYDLLMMKVLSLLQDDDQKLASAIVSSREAIWGLLADPKKFAALQA